MDKYAQMIVSAGAEQKSQEKGDPTISIVNPFLVINPVVFPTLYSFAITILLTGVDLTGKEVIEVNVISPNDNVVFSTGKSNSPSMPLGSNITMNLDLKNIMLKDQGKYTVDFKLNNKTLVKSIFFVKYLDPNRV